MNDTLFFPSVQPLPLLASALFVDIVQREKHFANVTLLLSETVGNVACRNTLAISRQQVFNNGLRGCQIRGRLKKNW